MIDPITHCLVRMAMAQMLSIMNDEKASAKDRRDAFNCYAEHYENFMRGHLLDDNGMVFLPPHKLH